MKRLIDLLLYGHFWIACAALAMSTQTRYLLTGTWRIESLDLFIAAGTLTIYALHRLVAMRLVPGRPEGRFTVMRRYQVHIVAYALVSGLAAAWLYGRLPRDLQLILLMPNLIALAYVIPLRNGRRLRDLPYVKIFLIALAWAWITVIAPARSLGLQIGPAVLLMAVERALFIFAITIPFDIRDLHLDRGAAVATLPGRWGVTWAKRVALAALVVTIICVAGGVGWGTYTAGKGAAVALSLIAAGALIVGAHPERHDYYYTGLLDGTMLLQAILVGILGGI